jgi:3-dehydroquinate synthetase
LRDRIPSHPTPTHPCAPHSPPTSPTFPPLPPSELASGISEIVKYGLIRDAALFEWLEANMPRLLARDAAAVAYAVERSCVNKAEVVAADEREGGVRATLNLGHTFGHAIETGCGYGTLLHGEAVSIGMVMAADMSVRLVSGRRRGGAQRGAEGCGGVRGQGRRRPRGRGGLRCRRHSGSPRHLPVARRRPPSAPPPPSPRQGWIDRTLLDRTRALLEAANLPVTPPATMTAAMFKDLMSVDKKVLAGKLRLVLLKGPLGGCVVTGDFDPAKLDETLAHFCKA